MNIPDLKMTGQKMQIYMVIKCTFNIKVTVCTHKNMFLKTLIAIFDYSYL